MQKTKYVIVDGRAIVFSAAITHSDMVGRYQKAEGAGFLHFKVEKDSYDNPIVVAKCYGLSVSLGVESREVDSEIVTRQISNTW